MNNTAKFFTKTKYKDVWNHAFNLVINDINPKSLTNSSNSFKSEYFDFIVYDVKTNKHFIEYITKIYKFKLHKAGSPYGNDFYMINFDKIFPDNKYPLIYNGKKRLINNFTYYLNCYGISAHWNGPSDGDFILSNRINYNAIQYKSIAENKFK